MADEKALETPKTKPEEVPQKDTEPAKVKAEKQDTGNDLEQRTAKLENEVKTWKGRYEKLQPFEKLKDLLADEVVEGEDPAMVALQKIESMEKELANERLERTKETYINTLQVPDNVKEVLRITITAGEGLEDRVEQVVEKLQPLIEKQPLPKPRPTGFVGDNATDLSNANAWIKKK